MARRGGGRISGQVKVTARVRYRFSGIVQGVGFRPFIYRTARSFDLAGFVQNRPEGVTVEVEGPAERIAAFFDAVMANLPPLAAVSATRREKIPPQGENGFRITASAASGAAEVLIPPDIALCGACERELFDPADRRHRYPFINCTDCGPRLTIITGIPYDRVNTSMACFPLCSDCRREYEDPGDRRFHAEPNACPVCGPALTLLDEGGRPIASAEPLAQAAAALRAGAIVAIKGLGGFHLACDATNDGAVARLRQRKYREEKPLALMVPDLAAAQALASLDAAEDALLRSPQRPIVLVQKKEHAVVSPHVAPGMPRFGIMLPYTPLHHLLLREGFQALVMTSGNRTDEPICIGNREAAARLAGIADGFLVHNRDILVRCDDSIAQIVAGEAVLSRRARGYCPKPVALRETFPAVLALGPQDKSTISILKGDLAFLSPHIGDLATPQARDLFHESIAVMEGIAECRPDTIACDLHPGYYSTLAARQGMIPGREMSRIIAVQHHHAHIVSCMAEHGLSGKVIGLAMDGTGYGMDGHVWGGEFLVADEAAFTRAGHIKEFLLPGGEKAVREPWRLGASLLREACGDGWQETAAALELLPDAKTAVLLDRMMERGLNSPPCSSLGRVFDGVAALLGLRRAASFEGQAAMELEGAAGGKGDGELPFAVARNGERLILDLFPAVREIAQRRLAGGGAAGLAAAFHDTLVAALTAAAETIREETGLARVVLAGGCFQNRLLLEGLLQRLTAAGFAVFWHRQVPTNDGGISLGQAVCAAARLRDGQSAL